VRLGMELGEGLAAAHGQDQLIDAPDNSIFPAEFSCFILGFNNYPLVTTQDPLGANAIMALSSQSGCEIMNVYSPALFVGSDSVHIDLNNATTSVSESEAALKLIKIIPNPSANSIIIYYNAVPGNLRLSIFDIQGRRLFEVLLRALAQNPRDHRIFSPALETWRPRVRVRLRREIAKGARVGDLFLPEGSKHPTGQPVA
jgi:hypothetical protein